MVNSHIWYACYGSNIRKARFLCYIQGGTPSGAVKFFEGCKDKSEPVESRPFLIDRELYFAKESIAWNGGGIGFLKPKKESKFPTYGRIYKITLGQFKDLLRQELRVKDNIQVDFNRLECDGFFNCLPGGRYGHLLHLGEIDDLPVISFSSEAFLQDEINPPAKAYLSTIIKGIKEVYDIKEDELFEYFNKLDGIHGTSIAEDLPQLVKEPL
ncbi:hypothetical protein C7S20_04925 [Christiangramia fulva]|uniref:Histone deacetylase n=1 Tax=Christiangramia fulva TaxID=2126553 RepID=A0A2R3Z321_9FLAO|nr:hypothetical protein [Christiangramia fulva]AVR44657.1 hypothetical protein C7S20_04925 [Christiangramia fulva]